MEKEKSQINLIGNKGKKTSDILLVWAIYIGRLLIILTETIALIVFLSRFSIDRKLIDYNDNIENQQATVNSFGEREGVFRNVHLRLKISKINIASTSATVNLFSEILSKADNDIDFSALSITPSALAITAQASTVESLAQLTQQIKSHPSVSSLSIDRVESRPKSAIFSITLNAQLKEKIK